jgi:hypothetical protein
VKKANARMELLRRVANFNPPEEDLKAIYILFIRSILERPAAVWYSSLSEDNKNDLERVQKTALKVILKEKYCGYQGLANLDLESLECRRENLCLKLKHMFPLNPKYHDMKTRNKEKYEG